MTTRMPAQWSLDSVAAELAAQLSINLMTLP